MAYPYKKIKLKDGSTRDEHRLVMEEYLERPLDSCEHVHHCNKRQKDNRIENLELTLQPDHARQHITPEIIKNIKKVGRETAEKLRIKGPEGQEFCQKCRVFKSVENFYPDPKRLSGYRKKCKKCLQEERKIWRDKQKEKDSIQGL